MSYNPNPSAEVVAAAQAVSAKHDAYEQSKLDFATAQNAVKLAEHNAEHAKHTDSAEDLVAAVEDADLLLRRSMVSAKVAAAMLAAAKQHHAKVLHTSLQTDYDQARAARLAACARADAARVELSASEADFNSATVLLQGCYNNGRIREFDGQHLGLHREHGVGDVQSVPTASRETEMWAVLASNTGA
jgi:hypothetical protein